MDQPKNKVLLSSVLSAASWHSPVRRSGHWSFSLAKKMAHLQTVPSSWGQITAQMGQIHGQATLLENPFIFSKCSIDIVYRLPGQVCLKSCGSSAYTMQWQADGCHSSLWLFVKLAVRVRWSLQDGVCLHPARITADNCWLCEQLWTVLDSYFSHTPVISDAGIHRLLQLECVKCTNYPC